MVACSSSHTQRMHTQGLVPNPEPFKKLLTQGMVLAQTIRVMLPLLLRVFYPKACSHNNQSRTPRGSMNTQDPETGKYLTESDLKEVEQRMDLGAEVPLTVSWEKMSKSKHNGIDPTEVRLASPSLLVVIAFLSLSLSLPLSLSAPPPFSLTASPSLLPSLPPSHSYAAAWHRL